MQSCMHGGHIMIDGRVYQHTPRLTSTSTNQVSGTAERDRGDQNSPFILFSSLFYTYMLLRN